MKLLKKIAAVSALILAAYGLARAARVVYSQTLVNETALAYNNTYTLDMGTSILTGSNVDSLSMQAVYSSATVAAVTFIDGTKSTATITINNFTALQGAQATNTLTVAGSTTNIVAQAVSFTLNGYKFVYADQWSVGSSSAATAINICTAINTYGGTNTAFSCSTTSLGVCTITVLSSGTVGNTYTLATSSSALMSVGGATFSGGKNHAVLVIHGTAFTEGTDFTAATSSHVTAGNIKNTINASSQTIGVVASTDTRLGIVIATSTSVGANTNYGTFSSLPSSMSISNNGFYGGTDSNVASNIITKSNKFTTGLPVLYTVGAGTSPQNLVTGTTYYVIRIDSSNFKLASSLANATAATPTAITVSTVTGGGSFTLTPLAITGTPSFKWQYSNDNSNWNDISVSSVTMTSLAAASTLWDFGDINYRYVRLNVVAPTQGGINLIVTGIGKSSKN